MLSDDFVNNLSMFSQFWKN